METNLKVRSSIPHCGRPPHSVSGELEWVVVSWELGFEIAYISDWVGCAAFAAIQFPTIQNVHVRSPAFCRCQIPH